MHIATPSFLDQAACTDSDPELWHPERGGAEAVRPAIAICRRCPVRAACFEWALSHTEQFGIYGGTTADERRMVLRQRRAS